MADFVKCDQCGELTEKRPDNTSCVVVVVATSIYDPRAASDMKSEYDRLVRGIMRDMLLPQERKQEHFDLCRECAMALLIALKSAKAKVLKGEVIRGH